MGLEVMEGETLVEEFRFKTVYNWMNRVELLDQIRKS